MAGNPDESRHLRIQWLMTAAASATAVAVITIVALVSRADLPVVGAATADTLVTVTDSACGAQLPQQATGPATFQVENTGSAPQEVYLVGMPQVGSVARTIVLGPQTSVLLSAVLGPGQYAFQCLHGGQETGRSPNFTAAGPRPANVTPAIPEAFTGELQKANNLYVKYVGHVLGILNGNVDALATSLAAGDTRQAKTDWLAAQRSWSSLGAAYDSFGKFGETIDGLRDASVAPSDDPAFTGLRRIEYGLYHGEGPQTLSPYTKDIKSSIAALSTQVPTLVLQKGSLALRAHEILEDALRDHLSGQDDQGSGMAFALTSADVDVTRTVVSDLNASLESRRPGFVSTVNARLDAIDAALTPFHRDNAWTRLQDAPEAQRRRVNAAVSAALETLADIPQLLVLPQGSE